MLNRIVGIRDMPSLTELYADPSLPQGQLRCAAGSSRHSRLAGATALAAVEPNYRATTNGVRMKQALTSGVCGGCRLAPIPTPITSLVPIISIDPSQFQLDQQGRNALESD